MNILMVSIDKGLLGQGQLGDVVERHKEYGREVTSLDIIVLSKKGYGEYSLSNNVKAFPTNSAFKWRYFFDGIKLGIGLCAKKKYDLIIAQDPFIAGSVALRLKNQFRTKLLVHCHGDFFNNPYWNKERWYNKWLLVFAREVVTQADAVRVMSRGQKEKFIALGLPEQKIRVISTPVDIERFERYQNSQMISALRQRLENRGLTKSILMVGRNDAVKDFPTLFKAFSQAVSRYPNLGLWLVGNFSPVEAESLPVPEATRRILAEGKIDSADLPAYYQVCDLVILTSTSESFGKVLVEANACGKPVVATDTTGAREIILDGFNGYLAPIGDASALAQKICAVLSDSVKAQELGTNGRKLVFEKFHGAKNKEKIIAYWNDIVSSSL